MPQLPQSFCVRPYQLIHIICKLGAGMDDDLGDERLTEILRLARKNPILPLTLRCNVSSIFRYQNPGRAEDTPEGPLFNDRRGLHILHKLGMVPGDTRPAIMLFKHILNSIETGEGICDGGRSDSDVWREQSDVTAEDYAKGLTINGNYHILDFSLFYGDIQQNAEDRIAAYKKNLSLNVRNP